MSGESHQNIITERIFAKLFVGTAYGTDINQEEKEYEKHKSLYEDLYDELIATVVHMSESQCEQTIRTTEKNIKEIIHEMDDIDYEKEALQALNELIEKVKKLYNHFTKIIEEKKNVTLCKLNNNDKDELYEVLRDVAYAIKELFPDITNSFPELKEMKKIDKNFKKELKKLYHELKRTVKRMFEETIDFEKKPQRFKRLRQMGPTFDKINKIIDKTGFPQKKENEDIHYNNLLWLKHSLIPLRTSIENLKSRMENFLTAIIYVSKSEGRKLLNNTMKRRIIFLYKLNKYEKKYLYDDIRSVASEIRNIMEDDSFKNFDEIFPKQE